MDQANPIEVPDEAVRNLMNDNPLEIELRGYELARWIGNWEVVGKYRPTENGRLNALQSCLWLSERWPNEKYSVRPIVSLNPPFPADEPIVPPAPPEQLALPFPSESA